MSDALSGDNAVYLSYLYQQYSRNPETVDAKWQRVFRDIGPISSDGKTDKNVNVDSANTFRLVQAYKTFGHLSAKLDPLNLEERPFPQELDPAHYGFSANDDQVYVDGQQTTLNNLLIKLEKTYCGTIGFEYMHIQDPAQREWVQKRIEDPTFSKLDSKKILTQLTHAEFFEKFLNVKFPGAKRFSLEGGESLIPALERVLEIYALDGVNEVCFGMAHRGRLSVLANILHQPLRRILALFKGQDLNPDKFEGSGDVKYHLGYSCDREIMGKTMHLSLTPNPSHLEAVNPVVLGKVRSKQDMKNDSDRKSVASILLHGDAAFAGQGLIAESLGLVNLEGYKTGGSLHIIINNQIGFTTSPIDAHSSVYATDVAKATQAPIFHVNADYPEDVVRVSSLAAEFVRTFKIDAIIDMVCYRRYGHNEADEPSFTQPIMYKTISNHLTTRSLYIKHVENTGILSNADIKSIEQHTQNILNKEWGCAR